jgi:hypothetical protein
MSHILKFENNSLRLYQANNNAMILDQPFNPQIGRANGAWESSEQALTYWNENMRDSYAWIANTDLTVEVS